MRNIDLFRDYENGKLSTAEEYVEAHRDSTVSYDRLPLQDVEGIPVCIRRNGQGQLEITFIPDTHLLAIGATRSGKTTGFVVPTLNVMLNKKNKPSMVISDPKQELYRENAKQFQEQGYRVLMLDFTNYLHSDCWNPLTKYYRAYKNYLNIDSQIDVVECGSELKNSFRGVAYDDQEALDRVVNEARERYLDEVEKGITALSAAVIPNTNQKDPFWDDSARDLLKALLYGMLEDIETGTITEENFSFDTALRIFDNFTDSKTDYDGGYFGDRPLLKSKAHQLARKCIIEQATTTRRCISSEFASKMNKFRDTAVRRITSANTFEMRELDDGAPTVIFVSYKDEESLHYEVISMFLSNLYTELIAVARKKGTALQRPFYFLLDEFGNLPQFNDFDKVISACGGRNIWFLLILQSYAQLNNVYGKETAEIIKDNLNTHIFFGTNNPETKREFSEECGKKTIISPISALNGSGEAIERYEKDTVALVPVSALTKLAPGHCIVTQMREDVLWSYFQRSYTCPEFRHEVSDPNDRPINCCFFDERYSYNPEKKRVERDAVEDMFHFYGERENKMNAFQIQQSLAGMPYVSIPWIQRKFDLTYSQAKTFLAQLQLRGWADKNVQGNRYAVRKENLRLRFLDRSEVDDLIMEISQDCGSVLRLLKKGKCVTFNEINDDINDEEDTAKAIAILVKHKLIYLVDDVYFSCVSDKALDALGAVARAKRYGRYGREESMDLEKLMQMREFFDILFEDDD